MAVALALYCSKARSRGVVGVLSKHSSQPLTPILSERMFYSEGTAMLARITLERRPSDTGTQLRLVATPEDAKRLMATYNVWPHIPETFAVAAWVRPKQGESVDAVINACSFLDTEPVVIDVEDSFFLPAMHTQSAEQVLESVRAAIRQRKCAPEG